MRLSIYLVCLLALSKITFAQTDSVKNSPLKYISNNQYLQYTTGTNFDMGLIAEINNFPSPKNVMALSKSLNLSDEQKNRIKAVLTEMNRKVLEMGKFILEQESKLNKLFETKTINEGSLIFYTNKIGALQGELRNAYLKAHYRTSKILTSNQLKKYSELINKQN